MEDGIFTHEQFHENRAKELKDILDYQKTLPDPDSLVICHPEGNEIICDVCNKEIKKEEELIMVRGSYALCVSCR